MNKRMIGQIKSMKKLFQEKKGENDKAIPLTERKLIMNSARTIGIIPKLESVKTAIEIDFETNITACVPNIDYTRDGDNLNSVKIDAELLKVALEIAKRTGDDFVTIFVNKDIPITFKTTEMDIIIAPQVKGTEKYLTEPKLDKELNQIIYELSRTLKKKNIPESKIREIINQITALLV